MTTKKTHTFRLAILIPMFNEQDNAERCVKEVCRVLKTVPHSKLFIVDDGSHDKTGKILSKCAKRKLPLTVLTHEKNRGYGAAFLTAAREAQKQGFEFGLLMDSDLTNDPALIPRFAGKLASNKYDVVKASRYIPEGGMRGVPWNRQLPTILGNLLASKLFNMGIRDCTNGFHAVRLNLICDTDFQERGFPVLLEELLRLKQKGARATEIPYILTARESEQGQSKFSYRPSVFWKYLKYALRAGLVTSA